MEPDCSSRPDPSCGSQPVPGAKLGGPSTISSTDDAVLPPAGEAGAIEAAAAVGMVIPEACLPGVVANLALLARHAETLRAPRP